ncbi:MAG: phosphatidylglycerol lysyltransferase domain-containing protein, partial [Enterococcus faecalis]|nr:phosphatidylglycerol lysyltransferase domain-containing protein [Enterococcus faecalis]
ALIYEFGSEIYSFQGLREYKEKFASKWQPRYTLYSKSSWIVYVMIALLIVDQKNID